MAARVLVIADQKMLYALAAGLREGGRFEVATAGTAEAAKAELDKEPQAAVLFYGTAEWPLTAMLQALAPARDKGVQLVVVLQRQQAPQRDECFRAGACDAFFMPLPKDQFVSRLAEALSLSYREEPGAKAAVQAASRTLAAELGDAIVTTGGVHTKGTLPFTPGQTVRLSWKAGNDPLASWGLVARSTEPGAQVRFAGLTREEESRIFSWLKSAPAQELPAAPEAPRAPRPATPPAGTPPPMMTPISTQPVAPAAQPAPPAAAAPPAATVTPASAAPSSLSSLFDDEGSPGASSQPPPPADPTPPAEASLGSPWPEPWSTDWCRAAAMALLRNQYAPAGPEGGGPIARRIADRMTSEQRTAADPPGGKEPTSAADALVARIALAGAQAAGEKLAARRAPVLVEAAAVSSLIALADAAGERLQKEANQAIAKSDTETLRLLTTLRGGLSQELLSFKKMVDQLRGLGVAPALGAGGLDPDMQVGRRAAPRAKTATLSEPTKKAAIAFADFGDEPKPRRTGMWLAIASAVLAISLANAFYFSRPRSQIASAADLERAGPGVQRIAASGRAAVVTVTPAWVEHVGESSRALADTLRGLKVELAVLALPDGRPVGTLNAITGRLSLAKKGEAAPHKGTQTKPPANETVQRPK